MNYINFDQEAEDKRHKKETDKIIMRVIVDTINQKVKEIKAMIKTFDDDCHGLNIVEVQPSLERDIQTLKDAKYILRHRYVRRTK